MIGFVLLALLGALAFGAVARAGAPRRLWSLVGAALLLGAAGYAWQGRPGLRAVAARPDAVPVAVVSAMVEQRGRMIGRFSTDTAYFTTSDALLRAGDRRAAARFMLGGVMARPGSAMLWAGLGDTLAIRDGDQLSPAALLAFRRSIQLAPNHPAPLFMLGLAYLRAGEPERTRRLWRRALELTPPAASPRDDLAKLLLLLAVRAAPPPAR